MFDQQLISQWVKRLRCEIPDSVAILVKGSVARGEAGPFSDLDLDVLTSSAPRDEYLAWIEDHAGRPVHVSVAVQLLADWLGDAHDPVSWSYGLPARETTQLAWARDDRHREMLDRPWREHPPAEPELEDTIDALGKVRNTFLAGDDLGVRQAAMSIAGWMPSLLIPLNPPVFAQHPREALDAVLGFMIAPFGYRDDMLRCLGMSPDRTTAGDLHNAAIRLVRGMLPLLRDHAAVMRERLPTDLYGMLVDGTLERYANHLVGETTHG